MKVSALILLLVLITLPVAAQQNECLMTLTSSGANVRTGPSTSNEVIAVTSGFDDIPVAAFSVDGRWVLFSGTLVESQTHYWGWMSLSVGITLSGDCILVPWISNSDLMELETGWPAYVAERIHPVTGDVEIGEVWVQTIGTEHGGSRYPLGYTIIGFHKFTRDFVRQVYGM
jgi:hypothetical protein